MQFEDLVLHLGEFGSYQKKVYLLLCYPMFVCALQKLMWVFAAARPNHRCQLAVERNWSAAAPSITQSSNPYYALPFHLLNGSIPWDAEKSRWDACHVIVPGTTTTATTTSGFDNNATTIEKCDAWVYDNAQYESSVVTEFNLVCDAEWIGALTLSLQMGGEFVGSILLGMFSDRFGRRLVMVLSAFMQTATGVIASFSPGIAVLIACRILVGFWTPGVVLTAYVIGMEFFGPSKRVLAGIGTQYFFAMGYLLIAVVAYFLRDWRHLQIALSLPSLLIVSFYWFVPESVRWMLTRNRKQEAINIIKKIAKANNKTLSDEFFLNEIKLETQTTDNIKDLFLYPKLRKRTIIVVYCWFVNSCVYYGFSLNTSNLGGSDYVNFALAAAVEFPAYTVCLLTLDRVGRRLPLCTSMILGGVSLFLAPFVPSEWTAVGVAFAMFGKFVITISYAIIYMFSGEVFPTTVRSASLGFSSTCGRVGAMIAPFMLLLRNYWAPLPPFLFSILALTSGLLCLLLPETHGRELPDTIQDVETFTNKKKKPTESALKTDLSAEDATSTQQLTTTTTTTTSATDDHFGERGVALKLLQNKETSSPTSSSSNTTHS